MKTTQNTSEIPALLLDLYDEAKIRCKNEEDARFRLALIGLINAFEVDVENTQVANRLKSDSRVCSIGSKNQKPTGFLPSGR